MTDVDGGRVVSADGTTIGWTAVGQGDPVLVLHGAMQSGSSQHDLARALSDRHRVVLADRRGRGQSGPFGPQWTPETEVADVAALLAGTGARAAIGISSGAILLLDAALTAPLRKLVLFEPPLVVGGSLRTGNADRLQSQLDSGDVAGALVTGMRAAEMGPALVRKLPRRLLERMTGAMMDRRDGDGPSMRELAPTLPYDERIVTAHAETVERYATVTVPTLLIGGTRSPQYLKTALDALERTLPDVRRVTLDGADHSATGNVKQRGKPAEVAAAIRTFLDA